MVGSHRRLTLRRAQRLLSGAPRDLEPGEVRFYNFYTPALQGGLHGITINQSISAPPLKAGEGRRTPQNPIPDDTQYFYVVAPKFVLPPDSVDSTYPANGGAVEAVVMPHVVLKDPHLPWARSPWWLDKDAERKNKLSKTPWLALLTFTVDELQLSQQQLDGIPGAMPGETKRVQSETQAVKMLAKDTKLLTGRDGITNAINYDDEWDAPEADKGVDVIFVKRELFVSLFTSDENPSSSSFDVSKYKYMSHVRQVATDGMAVGGAEDDVGLYGITVSHRTGPIGKPVPTTTVVHLVSLAMDPDLTPAKIPANPEQRVSMVSLHSFTYTCLPSVDGENSWARLENLGQKLNVMYPQKASVSEASTQTASMEEVVTKRQNDGYTLLRYRTITGDTTAAMYRGPLTPTFVPRWDHKKLNMQSNFGTDLQILDPNLSLMDLTYASAWQLGKTLAMGDDAFSAALSRLRNMLHSEALCKSKADVHRALGTYSTRGGTAWQMSGLIEGLNKLNDSLHVVNGYAAAADSNRWDHTCQPHPSASGANSQHVNTSMHSEHITPRLHNHALNAGLSAIRTSDGTALYNEFNMPANTDMAHVYSWVLDKLHLDNIPARYLLPDPSYLPRETLRFFYVDENWTDALIDGALSLANYWAQTPEKDCCRTAIKNAVNERLKTPDPALGGWHVQMPQYGFLIRSQLLVQFPDLAVAVEYSASRTQPLMRKDGSIDINQVQEPQAPILVQKRLSDDTMYCLFDCVPPDLVNITFTLPPHQQCFIIGQELDPNHLKVSFKKQYTEPDVQKRVDKETKEPLRPQETLTDKDGMFNWAMGTIKINAFVGGVYKRLRGLEGFTPGMNPKDYFEEGPNSAMLALQLNDPILQLKIAGVEAERVYRTPPGERFQLSVSAAPDIEPPILKPLERALRIKHAPILRPRPRSPRREAALLTSYIANQSAAVRTPRNPNTPAKTLPQPNKIPRPLWPRGEDPDRPKFDLKVYPIRRRDFVPTNSAIPLDLVFSIRFDITRTYLQYPLLGLHLLVPLGNKLPDNEDETGPLLTEDADPPMPTMLSNLRFNVVKSWYTDKGIPGERGPQKWLKLDVLPRSDKGIRADRVKDASFLLSRAPVVKYMGKKMRFAVVHMRYEYMDDDGSVVDPGWDDFAEVRLLPQ